MPRIKPSQLELKNFPQCKRKFEYRADLEFKCPSCGESLFTDPSVGTFECVVCNFSQEL